MDDLIAHIGETVIHVTAASNLPLIEKHGLLPAATLARRANVRPNDILLRKDRRVLQTDFGTAMLNHQKPIVHGSPKAGQNLDGISLRDWIRQLDERVFFWPEKRGADFAASIAADTPIVFLTLSTRRLLAAFPDHIDLAPINSGNFRQGGAYALRGPWVYVPAKAGLRSFQTSRRERGLVKSLDPVREISLRCAIDAVTLRSLRV
ncbi:MAG: hypothetical protein AAFP85_12285 [Pseudomonadota bacterium]